MAQKVPEYTKKAIAKYQKKFDRVNVNLEKGLKDRFQAVSDESMNHFFNRVFRTEIERLEKEKGIFDDDNFELPFK